MDYASLKSTVLDWLARQDISDPVFEGFVTIVEQTISAELKCFDTEKVLVETPVPSDLGYLSVKLPKDFREARVVTFAGNTLLYVEPQKFIETPDSKGFTIIGGVMQFGTGVVGTGDAQIIYYSRVPHININNLSNAIIEKYPNVYLFGCLREAYSYISDMEKASLMDTRMERAIEEARFDADTSAYSGSVLTPQAE